MGGWELAGDDLRAIRRVMESEERRRERRFVVEALARYGKLVADLTASEAESAALGPIDWDAVFRRFSELEPLIRALARRAPAVALPWAAGDGPGREGR